MRRRATLCPEVLLLMIPFADGCASPRNARADTAAPVLHLGTVSPRTQTGELRVDRSAAGAALNIGGLPYARGLGVRGASELVYAVPPGSARFEAWVGPDAASGPGSIRFQLYADGRLAFDSGPLAAVAWERSVNPNHAVGVKVPLAGVRELRLVTTTVEGEAAALAGDWAEAGCVPPGVPEFEARAEACSRRVRREHATPPLEHATPPLTPTPPMGWCSWNAFGTEINEQVIHATADAIVASGLREAGYVYVNLDDGWQNERGDAWNAERFPSGMKALGDYIHARGLRFGIYSRPVWVRGEEERIARAFAAWGVDYLKYDFSDEDAERTNGRMIAAVRAATGGTARSGRAPGSGRAPARPSPTTGTAPVGEHAHAGYSESMPPGERARTDSHTSRPIVFNVCEWGKNRPWEWAGRIDAQTWRATYDVVPMWDAAVDSNRGLGVLKAVDQLEALGAFSTGGRWNDPDMLVVGLGHKPHPGHAPLTAVEQQAHFGLWCLLAAPLLIGCDVRTLDEPTRALLTNRDAIAIDQDPLGVPGYRVRKLGELEVWKKPLAGGDVAVGLFNRGEQAATMAVRWEELFVAGGRYDVRDVWQQRDLGEFDGGFERVVGPHEMVMVRLTRR
jgi:alpha-galactosidase